MRTHQGEPVVDPCQQHGPQGTGRGARPLLPFCFDGHWVSGPIHRCVDREARAGGHITALLIAVLGLLALADKLFASVSS